jgi:hypothetical protein
VTVTLGERLALLGLRDVERVVTHTNRTVMLTLSRGVLRLHAGYAFAPDRVLRAIVRFLNPRVPRRLRRAAQQELLAFPVDQHAPSRPPRPRQERARPGDLVLLHRLETLHRELNRRYFDDALGPIPFRLSGRMRTRLGELSVDRRTGRPIDIGLSRRHLAQHPWVEVEHTLLHEMVHQWQAETGRAVDHGPSFRAKASTIGILPRATRPCSRGPQAHLPVHPPARLPNSVRSN